MNKKNISNTIEGKRLQSYDNKKVPLPFWGPYLSERQWGTVREDYSSDGNAWEYFPHDHARSRVYKWGEDGIAGLCDYGQNICFGISMWNGKDSILKERLFGLANGEGNHGEDVKELYYHVDNVPTHSYMKYLYKYPQEEFPYDDLKLKNRAIGLEDEEYEILDTGVFDEGKYFDVEIEYAKESENDIHIKITVTNRHIDAAEMILLPQLWFYNRWQYGGVKTRPVLQRNGKDSIKIKHERTGDYYFYSKDVVDILFTENETNSERLFRKPNRYKHVKDAFHDAIVDKNNYGELAALEEGTKSCVVYPITLQGGDSKAVYLRLCSKEQAVPFGTDLNSIFKQRKDEADEFYDVVIDEKYTADEKNIQRKAFSGLLWSKQFYHYDVQRWLHHDDGITPLSDQRINGRNSSWKYLKNQDVMLMPDKWEYPWYASWDTAFQCIGIGIIDPSYAKNQLILLMREWFMSPQGQIPAYEWDFSDINPPVHAFAALQVYFREKEQKGKGDLIFLKRIFQKLMLNFTWWVNETDKNGNSIFEGGFLGLDNIGVFNRSHHVPEGVSLEQADATSWVGMYALNLMEMALEIAQHDIAFQDAATKFYEHFVIIAEALNIMGIWNEKDKYFYDNLTMADGERIPIRVKSIVGIAPIFDVATMSKECIDQLPDFARRTKWFNDYRTENYLFLPNAQQSEGDDMLLSLVREDRLLHLLRYLLDENEFLAPGGIRSLSKCHEAQPYTITIEGEEHTLQYDPGNSTSMMFGGNSNWRGPVWMPINYLIISSIKKFGKFYGDNLQVDYPTGSGNKMNLSQIAEALTHRLLGMFKKDEKDNRPSLADSNYFYQRPENKDLLLFYEYYNGNTSKGLGASHQTGWTAVLVDLLR